MSTSPADVTFHGQVRGQLAASDLSTEAKEAVLGVLGEPPRQVSDLPRGIYLGGVAVSGFRGIGRSARLPLRPANGLTLVTGRNGSGKSSFAEAVEIALTGANSRWKDKSQVWTSSFANLHGDLSPEIEVELAISGDREPSLVHCHWTGSKVSDSLSMVSRPGRDAVPLAALNLDLALADYRPFLPYAELGSALERPTEIYDKISAILGLGPLASACKTLHDEVLALEKTAKAARRVLPELLARLAEVSDPRARRAHAELSLRDPGLDAIEALATGDRRDEDQSLRALRRLAELTGPDAQAVRQAADRLRTAARDAERVRGTAAQDARDRADLLERALGHHRRHPQAPTCPVCETPERLDDDWAARASGQIARLRSEASTAESAARELNAASAAAARLVADVPPGLPAPLAEAWRVWSASRSLDDLDEYVRAGTHLSEECRLAREGAVAKLADQDGRWQEIAPAVAAWCRDARAATTAMTRLRHARQADTWLRAVHDDLRGERMAAQGQDARGYWQAMRQQSNVALGEIRLAGKGGMRRAELEVTVDDIPGAALGVMSQGELHALALSLFLPRAMLPDSPFRFLIIDDPVQSMDPAKVDGLALILEMVSRSRQVVVFTHDSRLPEAVRRLRIPATILEVVRRERSEIDVVPSDDPVERALKDARTIASHPRLPVQVGPAVLPGLCRVALDAAFVEMARRRLLGEGADHDTVERRIAEARPTGRIAALALGVGSTGEVARWLTQNIGPWAGDVFVACNKGTHDPEQFHQRFQGKGDDPIEYVTKLTRRLREVR